MHTTFSSDQIATDTQRLDRLIALLEHSGSERDSLLLEHVKSARTYLLGGMPDEYAVALDMAREAPSAVWEPELRDLASEILGRLKEDVAKSDSTRLREGSPSRLNPRHHVHTPPQHLPTDGANGRLWTFLGGAPTRLGTFYPTSYVTAILPSLDAAQAALRALSDAGFDESEAIAVSGLEMLEFFEELRARRSVGAELMVRLSRTFGTEQLFADFDVRMARNSAGFLLVYNPEAAEAERIREIIAPFGPISMQRYLTGAVEGMVKTPKISGPEL